LFATLDTTLRKLVIPGSEPIVLSDTVGFIRDLPHELVAAFRATIKEAVDADLILHVIDASHPGRDGQIAAVDEYGKINRIRLSALTGGGVPELRAAMAEWFPRSQGWAATA